MGQLPGVRLPLRGREVLQIDRRQGKPCDGPNTLDRLAARHDKCHVGPLIADRFVLLALSKFAILDNVQQGQLLVAAGCILGHLQRGNGLADRLPRLAIGFCHRSVPFSRKS